MCSDFRTLPTFLVVVLTAVGPSCTGEFVPSPPTPEDDAGVLDDGGAGDDAGAFGDAGLLFDAGPLEDAGSDDDGGVLVDGGEPAIPREMRGLWITRFAYTDEETLTGILDRAAAHHVNAVFVQVRGAGDAYYASSLEPWARSLTGVLGRDPGWDPLDVAVTHGHALGLEVHAYVNALSAWPASLGEVTVAEGDTQHPLYTHPEWAAVTSSGVNEDTEYVWFSAANPEVQEHTAAVVTDILTHYDVDGIHLDRIRMPGPDYSHDDTALQRFADRQAIEPAITFDAFMRDEVSTVVENAFVALLETRPEAKLSASVWGIYERLPGCFTSEGKVDFHQDSIDWAARGIVDALAPMIYWAESPGACTDFRAHTQFFVDESAPAKVWTGVHVLEINDGDVFSASALSGRLATSLEVGAEGSVLFASNYLDADAARWDALKGDADAPGPFFTPIAPPGPAVR
jgi:hypothetical protein